MPDSGSLPDGFDRKDVNKVLIFLSKEVLSEVPLPGAKHLSGALTYVLEHSLALPKDQEEIINGKLDAISQKTDALGRQFDDYEQLSMVVNRMVSHVSKVNGKIIDWWNILKRAEDKNYHDFETFQRTMLAIGLSTSEGMHQTMVQLHHELAVKDSPLLLTIKGIPLNAPLLEMLRNVLEKRVTSSDECFTYGVVALHHDIERWISYLSGMQAKGIALQIMYEKFRLVQAKDGRKSEDEYKNLQQIVASNITALDQKHTERLQTYTAILRGGVLAYPSAQLMLKEAAINLASECPTLYSLNLWDSDKYLRINRDTAELEDIWRLDPGEPNFSQAFGFVHTSYHTWVMRGSRFDAHPDAPNRWTVCRGDQGDKVGLFNDNRPADLKIVPHPSGSGTDARVTLLLLNEDRNEVKKRWNVWVQEKEHGHLLTKLSFVTAPNPWQRVADILGRAKRVMLWINNLTNNNLVFVLQNVRASCSARTWFVTNGSIWLNQQRGCVGLGCPALSISDSDAEFVLQLRVYQLRSDINAQERSAVEPLVFQDPVTGRLSLRGDRAKAHTDIFIKVWNPSGMSRNYISAVTFMPGTYELGPNWSDLHPEHLGNALDKVKIVQTERRENPGWGVRMGYHIKGSNTPDGDIDIDSWGNIGTF